MKRLIVATLAGVALLSGCATDNEPSLAELEQGRFEKCVAAGGSYISEDTSAGNKWTCTMPNNPQHTAEWQEK